MFNYGNAYGGYNNPYQPQMDRLQQLQQNQQQMQQLQQPQQQMQQSQQQSVIPVGGLEEVKAYPMDWSGNATYFIDNAKGKIYTKQLGVNGIPSITTYSVDTSVANAEESYCTKEEYNALKSEIDNYKGVLDNLLSQLGGKKDV